MDERNSEPDCPECFQKGVGARVITIPSVLRVEGGATHTGRDIFPDVGNEPDW